MAVHCGEGFSLSGFENETSPRGSYFKAGSPPAGIILGHQEVVPGCGEVSHTFKGDYDSQSLLGSLSTKVDSLPDPAPTAMLGQARGTKRLSPEPRETVIRPSTFQLFSQILWS